MRPLAHLTLTLATLACVTTNAPRRPPSPILTPPPAAPAAPAASAQPGVACALEDVDVPFETPLMLLHELPAHDAMVEHPFAEVTRAARLRVSVPVGDGADAPLLASVETAMLHLDGVAHSARLTLYPSRPSTFGEFVTPLAGHHLQLGGASPGSLRLALTLPRQVRIRTTPEWRDCSYARLRPVAPFGADVPPPARPAGHHLAPGQWSLYPSPRAVGGSRGVLDLEARDTVAVLEERDDRWARVLWTGEDTAVVGWVDRRNLTPRAFGHGSGTGAGQIRRSCQRAVTCAGELRLLADDRGLLRDIGRTKPGALVTVGDPVGAFTRVVVCDPEVQWADGVPILSPTEQVTACAQ